MTNDAPALSRDDAPTSSTNDAPALTIDDYPIVVVEEEQIIVNPDVNTNPSAIDLYLDLMKRCLTNLVYEDDLKTSGTDGVEKSGRIYCKNPKEIELLDRIRGCWSTKAHTMIGLVNLESLQACIKSVLVDNVPGDFIETGVWRGGATIFMRAMLQAYGITNRKIWVADSFDGIPPPTAPLDKATGIDWSIQGELAIPIEQVKKNFQRYRLLDSQVCFLKGWFKDTLPTAPIDKLAILRLDGDLYESTMNGLQYLYPKLSSGGYVLVDDYSAFPGCKEAVTDYRHEHNISDELLLVRGSKGAVVWRKS